MSEWGPGLALLLGLVEGLTEFLPVSSTGHLIILGHWLGFTGAVAVSVEISIQLGSILAVIAYERSKLAALLSQAVQEQAALRAFWRRSHSAGEEPGPGGRLSLLIRSTDTYPSLRFLIGIGLAFLPAAAVGLLAHKWIEAHLFTPYTVAVALIAGGLIILVVEGLPNRARVNQLEHVGLVAPLFVGLAQCASLIPGVSRSGATIVGGLLAGLDRKVATEYSFFLALPTMIAATTYKMLKSRELLTSQDALALALGLVVSFLVAWAVIAAFLSFVKRHTLRAFAYYRLLLGLAVLLVFS
jgi:undecaprenyl-diphosphatase